MALSTDKDFKPYAQKYAKDEDAFFSDFSKAFSKCVPALLSLLLPPSVADNLCERTGSSTLVSLRPSCPSRCLSRSSRTRLRRRLRLALRGSPGSTACLSVCSKGVHQRVVSVPSLVGLRVSASEEVLLECRQLFRRSEKRGFVCLLATLPRAAALSRASSCFRGCIYTASPRFVPSPCGCFPAGASKESRRPSQPETVRGQRWYSSRDSRLEVPLRCRMLARSDRSAPCQPNGRPEHGDRKL